MSVHQTIHAGYLRIGCDHRGCPALEGVDFYPGYPAATADHELREHLAAQGWTFWHGRETRIYCPAHGPSRGSHMRDVTDSYGRSK